MMSSMHGPYMLGYTRVTITIGSKVLRQSESKKMALVWIVSNCGSACCSEYVLKPYTRCLSHHGNWFHLKHQTKDHPLL